MIKFFWLLLIPLTIQAMPFEEVFIYKETREARYWEVWEGGERRAGVLCPASEQVAFELNSVPPTLGVPRRCQAKFFVEPAARLSLRCFRVFKLGRCD